MRIRAKTSWMCGVASLSLVLLLGCQSEQPSQGVSETESAEGVRAHPDLMEVPEPTPLEPSDTGAIPTSPWPNQKPFGEIPDKPTTAPSDSADPSKEGEASQPATATETSVEQPAPTWPSYLDVLARFDSTQPARVQVILNDDYRLLLDTWNVKRLRIDRKAASLTQRRSIVLRLDDQPFEWLVDSPVTVFERSEQGVWRPVPPDQSTRRDGGDGG